MAKEQRKELKQILIEGNYVTVEDIQKAEAYAEHNNVKIEQYLLDEDLINKNLLGQATAESMGVGFSDLKAVSIGSEEVNSIPEDIGRELKVVVVHMEKKNVTVATDDPENPELAKTLREIFRGSKVKITYGVRSQIEDYFVYYKKPLDTRFAKILEKEERVAPEILDEIFDDALILKASDIHFEPRKDVCLIRFRVDGILQEVGRIPINYYENILNRIKVKSGLRIDEHFATQDGALHYESKTGAVVDMRTSIVPTITGEKVCLRVLASYIQALTLHELGLSDDHQAILDEAIHKPFGMILVVGPTGSGKTTTLYALLKMINSPDVNITTIEDPVEYKVVGMNQIQVNVQTNLTFANGLRSIVRQDPDKILVGEIRDEETAEISVNAALTGHLLLSTFHANDAPTCVPRIMDMNIEPFLLASTLEVIVAQRLVRRICGNCRYSIDTELKELDTPKFKTSMRYFPEKTFKLYKGKGCKACKNTGYRGQTALYEFITVDQKMEELIINRPTAQDIWTLARENGAKTLFEDGIDKVKLGITTLEDLLRVAQPPEVIAAADNIDVSLPPVLPKELLDKDTAVETAEATKMPKKEELPQEEDENPKKKPTSKKVGALDKKPETSEPKTDDKKPAPKAEEKSKDNSPKK